VLRIRDDIPDADFYPSRIPDPGSRILDLTTAPKEEGEKIFCSHKYHKIVNNFIFEQVKKKFWSQNTRNYSIFTQIFDNKLSKIGFGEQMNRIPDLQHWTQHRF
jgi:hypothetical protein